MYKIVEYSTKYNMVWTELTDIPSLKEAVSRANRLRKWSETYGYRYIVLPMTNTGSN